MFSFLQLKQTQGVNDLHVLKLLNSEEKRICIDAGRAGGDGEPTSDTYVFQWTTFCDLEGVKAVKNSEEKLSFKKSRVETIDENLHRVCFDERLNLNAIKLKPARDELILSLTKTFKATEYALERVIRDISLVTSKISYHTKYNEYVPTKKTFWDKSIGGVIASGSITTLESVTTIPALQESGYDNWLAWFCSLLLSSIIGISCHFAGEAHIHNNKRKKFAWLIAGFSVIAIIIYWRRHVEDNFIYSFINLIIFFVGVLLSIRRHSHKLFWDMIDLKNTLETKEDFLKENLKLQADQLSQIEDEFKTKAIEQTEAEIEGLHSEKARMLSEITILTKQKENVLKAVTAKKENGTTRIKQMFEEGRNRRLVKINSSWSKTAIIILSFLLSLGSCSSHTEKSEIMIVFDKSKSVTIERQDNADRVYAYFIDEVLKLEDDDNRGLRIDFSIIGASSQPKVNKIELTPGASSYLFQNKKKRKAALATFKNELKKEINKIVSTSPDEPYTNLNRSLCYQLNFLQRSDFGAQQKSVYVFSDLIQSTREISFEPFIKNPAGLDTAYERISSIMAKDCPMSDLKGISINVVYQADIPADELVRASGRFWQKYLSKHGANFFIFSNL